MSSAQSQTSARAELLAGVAFDLLRFEKPEPLLASAFRRLSETMDADLCFCFLFDEDRLDLVYADGIAGHLRDSVARLGLEDGICGKAARAGCYLTSEDIQNSADPAMAFLKSIGAQAFYCHPLIAGTRMMGALSFGTRRAARFSAEDLELQRVIAGEVAVGLDRMRLMAELTRKNQTVEVLAANLRRAQTDLEQFAFSASHDLREPLRHLLLFSELLRAQTRDVVNRDARRYLSVIARSARRIELLVKDLLAYTQAGEDSQPDEQNANANGALADALSRLSGEIRDSKASIRAAALPSVRISPRHLAQLFRQLIENALKYRRPGVPPEVHVFTREQDGKIVFCVQDNGIGIAPEYRHRVFGLFKRLHTCEEYEGTGIGLAICQKIVEYYEGEIWVESQTGEGATFCFTLGKSSERGEHVQDVTYLHRRR